jgi:hypothetical protein
MNLRGGMSTIESTEPDEGAGQDLLPRVPLLPTRGDASVLFGCWVAERRNKTYPELSDFAATLGRTDAWVVALEVGLLFPSTTALEQLNKALNPNGHDDDVPANVLSRLVSNPWHSEAIDLRERYGLAPLSTSQPAASRSAEAAASPTSWLSQIRSRDKLLTVAPAVAWLTVISLVAAGHAWNNDSISFWSPDLGNVAAVGTLILALLTLSIPSVGNIIDHLVFWLRDHMPGRSALHNAHLLVKETRQAEHDPDSREPDGAWIYVDQCWYSAEDEPYLIPTDGDEYKALANDVDLGERILFILSTSAWLTGASAIVAFVRCNFGAWSARVSAGDTRSNVVADILNSIRSHEAFDVAVFWTVIALALLVIRTLSKRRLLDMAEDTSFKLDDAYGRRFVEPSG